jgi:hypothetical protein
MNRKRRYMAKRRRAVARLLNEPLPDYGDLFPLEEFITMCRNRFLINYDGSGCYATARRMARLDARPSDIAGGRIDRRFSHVMWFNRWDT